jgi:hypothetical protein
MMELFRVFSLIALSRNGPQDLPASPILLGLTVVGFYLVNFAVNLVLPSEDSWHLHLVVEVAFTLAWYAVLLRAFGKPERFLQTATAMFGYQLVLAPLSIATLYLSRRFGEDTLLQFPVVVIGLAIAIWIIRAGGYVLKAALELPMIACVVLILLQVLAGQLVLVAMTPEEAAALAQPAQKGGVVQEVVPGASK